MPELAPQIPSAAPRRSGGKPETAPASDAGLTSPAPTPCTTRDATSTPKLPATAPRSPRRTANTASPTERDRREPIRSTRRAAREQRQPVGDEVGGQHPGRAGASLASNSSPTDGSATVTIVPSICSSAAAAAQAASLSQASRAIGGPSLLATSHRRILAHESRQPQGAVGYSRRLPQVSHSAARERRRSRRAARRRRRSRVLGRIGRAAPRRTRRRRRASALRPGRTGDPAAAPPGRVLRGRWSSQTLLKTPTTLPSTCTSSDEDRLHLAVLGLEADVVASRGRSA